MNKNKSNGKTVIIEILLSAYRQEKNISLIELAEAVGVDEEFIISIENGKVDVPLNSIVYIAAYLDVPLWDLIEVSVLPGDSSLVQ